MSNYTIEPDGNNEYLVFEHGEYERSSVLAGQPRRTFVEAFETVAEALDSYPGADVISHSTRIEFDMPDVAPAWFDPADAGERWDEDY